MRAVLPERLQINNGVLNMVSAQAIVWITKTLSKGYQKADSIYVLVSVTEH